MITPNLSAPSGAIFSECRRYRGLLWRLWNDVPNPRWLVCCALNCSTADAEKDDPTVGGMVSRGKSWGYDGFIMVNLFEWRSTDPKGLLLAADPVGLEADGHILFAASIAATFICAWGSSSKLIPARASAVLKMLRDNGVNLHYLRMGKTGQPWHPLYLPHALEPTEWRLDAQQSPTMAASHPATDQPTALREEHMDAETNAAPAVEETAATPAAAEPAPTSESTEAETQG